MFFRLFRVRGRSMLPTLGDGDFVIARRLGADAVHRLDGAAIVCVEHPHFGPLIKRIERVSDGVVHLTSDGVTGSDSADLGSLPVERVTHRARLAIRRRGGVRWL